MSTVPQMHPALHRRCMRLKRTIRLAPLNFEGHLGTTIREEGHDDKVQSSASPVSKPVSKP
ncbi:MAG TPA: hypothetical protein DFR83_20925, partial [Deltaproteobacteria bacterium]|nr:hypothetical protein [Deltaproteobacteria bacterium]